jgi:hypothetical protein
MITLIREEAGSIQKLVIVTDSSPARPQTSEVQELQFFSCESDVTARACNSTCQQLRGAPFLAER